MRLPFRLLSWFTRSAPGIDREIESDPANVTLGLEFVRRDPDVSMNEDGDAVEQQWEKLVSEAVRRSEIEQRDWMDPFVLAASKRPELRQLSPQHSIHGYFMFRRCTGYPSSWDLPMVARNSGSEHLVYDVIAPQPSASVLGTGDADYAADLVVKHLPQDCGPAFVGSVLDLAQQIALTEGVPVDEVLERLCPGPEELRPRAPDRGVRR